MSPGLVELARQVRRAVLERERSEGVEPVREFLVAACGAGRRQVSESLAPAGVLMEMAEMVLGPVTEAEREACRSRTDESVRPLVSRKTKNPPADAVCVEDLEEGA